ncbi:MAG TPA: hypothetical protein VGI14_19175 [Casimicrobiaceae bacterium]|jgi:hypothetical protein
MSRYELLGYVASALVLATFWMRRMVMLRTLAIASNLAFIAYGFLAGIMPVLLLHALLLPLNLHRMVQWWRARPRRAQHPLPTPATTHRVRPSRAGPLRERMRRCPVPSRFMR